MKVVYPQLSIMTTAVTSRNKFK